jgi:GR25 family glycosyltransferase involved in LPS biosynthesis
MIGIKMNISNKLLNFPSVYCTTLEESIDRQDSIKKQFIDFDINTNQIIPSKRYQKSNDIIVGKHTHYLDKATLGCVCSHLRMIKKWYDETNEDYAFFCEDDLSFETVQYWNFSWKDFVDNLPKNWDCVQLICIGEHLNPIQFRKRYWDDWSVGAYILNRKYAKLLIDSFIDGNVFKLEFPQDHFWAPLAENLIYYAPETLIEFDNLKYNVYSFPLFVENIKFNSTFDEFPEHKEHHVESYNSTIYWWKNTGKNLTLKQLLNK